MSSVEMGKEEQENETETGKVGLGRGKGEQKKRERGRETSSLSRYIRSHELTARQIGWACSWNAGCIMRNPRENSRSRYTL